MTENSDYISSQEDADSYLFDDDALSELSDVEDYKLANTVPILSLDDVPFDRDLKYINVAGGARPKTIEEERAIRKMRKNIMREYDGRQVSKPPERSKTSRPRRIHKSDDIESNLVRENSNKNDSHEFRPKVPIDMSSVKLFIRPAVEVTTALPISSPSTDPVVFKSEHKSPSMRADDFNTGISYIIKQSDEHNKSPQRDSRSTEFSSARGRGYDRGGRDGRGGRGRDDRGGRGRGDRGRGRGTKKFFEGSAPLPPLVRGTGDHSPLLSTATHPASYGTSDRERDASTGTDTRMNAEAAPLYRSGDSSTQSTMKNEYTAQSLSFQRDEQDRLSSPQMAVTMEHDSPRLLLEDSVPSIRSLSQFHQQIPKFQYQYQQQRNLSNQSANLSVRPHYLNKSGSNLYNNNKYNSSNNNNVFNNNNNSNNNVYQYKGNNYAGHNKPRHHLNNSAARQYPREAPNYSYHGPHYSDLASSGHDHEGADLINNLPANSAQFPHRYTVDQKPAFPPEYIPSPAAALNAKIAAATAATATGQLRSTAPEFVPSFLINSPVNTASIMIVSPTASPISLSMAPLEVPAVMDSISNNESNVESINETLNNKWEFLSS